MTTTTYRDALHDGAVIIDKHLRNVSHRYDFDSLRVGIQPFSSDFRGFLFQDAPFGVRLAHRLSPAPLRKVFGGLLLVVAVRMLYSAIVA